MLSTLFSFTQTESAKEFAKPSPNNEESINQKNKKENSHKIFEGLALVKKISQAKFPVYLVESSSAEIYAMKVYPYKNGKLNPRFINEIRFSQLSHPNVIAIVAYKEEVREKLAKMSYILMDYAPNGDFFDLVMNSSAEWNEKLARTYFHQLIDGIGYLHSRGIAHLDLKLENLLLGDDFTLKIADFDLSHLIIDGKVSTKGTKNYRAPEVMNQTCQDPRFADIYSAGILLFVMKCGGFLPYLEDQVFNGIDLHNLLFKETQVFWEKHIKIQKKRNEFFDADFKFLFESMTRMDPLERMTITQIKASKWYQGPTYSRIELSDLIRKTYSSSS